MDERDFSIIAQSASNHASQIVAGMPIEDARQAIETWDAIHDYILTSVLGRIGELVVTNQLPGTAQPASQTPAPTQPQYNQPPAQPQTGPAPQQGMGAVSQFPTAQPAPMPAPQPYNPSANTYQGGAPQGTTSSSPEEQEWHNYFQNPNDWYDNRGSKKNERGPDFRHKTRKDAKGFNVGLWLKGAPQWVVDRLGAQAPPQQAQQPQQGYPQPQQQQPQYQGGPF